MKEITILQLEKVKLRIAEKQINLSWEDSVPSYLAEEGYDPSFGARPLKRLIQQEVVNLLSTLILEGTLKSGQDVCLKINSSAGKKSMGYMLAT
jgi:ATP-dependent Clp protease ATP-binding subunit ClpB